MPIPNFNENGLLPEGVHNCTLDELSDIFTTIPNKDKRKQLFEQLLLYVERIKRAHIPCRHLVIDGSYVTDKEEPSDIDLAIVTPWDYAPSSLTDDHYAVMHKDTAQALHGFNIFPVLYESDSLDEIKGFFMEMKPPVEHLKKGILWVSI